jgi:hypothetical protein
MLSQHSLNVAKPRPGGDGEHEIGRLVVEDAGQPRGGEDQIESFRRVTEAERRATAHGRKLPIAGRGCGEQFRAFLTAAGSNDFGCDNTVDTRNRR